MLDRFEAYYSYKREGKKAAYLVSQIVVAVEDLDQPIEEVVRYFKENFTTEARLIRLRHVATGKVMSVGLSKRTTNADAFGWDREVTIYNVHGEA